MSLAARAAAVLCAAAVTTVAVAAPAAAADSPILGTVALTPASGLVTDDPFVTAATTSAPCPTGYGQNSSLRVGPVGGPFTLLVRIGSAGRYDQAPVTFAANRSLATALGATPADGTYEVVVTCSGVPAGPHPRVFSTLITVAGTAWSVKPATTTTIRLRARPRVIEAGREVVLTARVTPATATGTVDFRVDGTIIGTVPVVAGRAELRTATLTAGVRKVDAGFTAADARAYGSSTSAVGCLVVVPGPA